MDFKSAMETFAEAWMVANTNGSFFGNGGIPSQNQALPLTTPRPYSDSHNVAPTDSNHSVPGKTISIRCIVESVPNAQYLESHNNYSSQVEMERKANVPAHTVFQNLLQAVLQMFGYPKETVIAAKGYVLIENWKPIKLEKIAQNSQKSVSDIFGQIGTFVTLRIQILRASNCSNVVLGQMKEKMLQLLILQNRDHILSSGCPLDQVTLKSILRGGGDYGGSVPSDEIIRRFEQWIGNQYRQVLRPPVPYAGPVAQFPFHLSSAHGGIHHRPNDRVTPDRLHPAIQTVQSQYPTQKTRMRTSFDPELELPKLQKWFAENQHPSRQQIQNYVNELNGLESRRGRKPLDNHNVVYWFKNARAAQKRAEIRNSNPGLCNGYQSDSPPEECKGSLESGRSDDEDDDMDVDDEGDSAEDGVAAPPSPAAPLSLITHRESSDSTPVKVKQEPPDRLQPSEETKKVDKSRPPACTPSDTDEAEVEDDASISEGTRTPKSFRSSSPVSLTSSSAIPVHPGFPLASSVFSQQNFMYMIPGLRNPMNSNGNGANNNALSQYDDKRKRNRTFIDPVTEVPCLERWFCRNTHPPHALILQYTEDLNSMPYRQKFPRLEPKNVQFWFKNRRAKCKRLKSSLYENMATNLSPREQYHQLAAALSNETYRNHD